MKSKQPIFVVNLSEALILIDQFTTTYPPSNSLQWGNISSSQSLMDAVQKAPLRSPGYVDLSTIATIFNGFHTCKMIGNANRYLIQLFNAIKKLRISVDILP